MIGNYKEYIIASCYVNLVGGQIESHKRSGGKYGFPYLPDFHRVKT